MSVRWKMAFLLAVIALCLGSALAAADGVADYVNALGLTPEVSDNPGGSLCCDYTAVSADMAEMMWSDAAHAYTVSGDSAVLAPAYVEILGIGQWERCCCDVGDMVRIAYGDASEGAFDDLDRYIERVARTLLGASAAEGGARHYVLNNNTMKFHHPDCASAAKIKDKNREEYDGRREDLIARGYSPCGNCKP